MPHEETSDTGRETPRVSVVVPCYNEAENIPLLAAKVEKAFAGPSEWSYECLFVDDGSTDDTRKQVDRACAANPRMRYLRLVANMGQSAALVAGMRDARGEYILTIDGDLQNDPADFPRFLELLQDYDCVCGYREKRNDAWVRRLSSRVANQVRNWVLHDGIRDTGCGLKGFRRRCVPYIVSFNGVHRFFGVLMRNAGLSIVECPVAHRPRIHGTSKYGIGNRLPRGLFDLVGVVWLKRRYVHPTIETGQSS
ncbi:MAG: glycosyltransferase family 2 protein [Candidatus Hydrogenedentes bacterium]|nr:glycosyltransferase family 2 protein [Candidatus Hydrogenedentota bacterium]